MRMLSLLLAAMLGPAHLVPHTDLDAEKRGPLVSSVEPIDTECRMPTYTIDECRWDVCNAGAFFWQADRSQELDGIVECGLCMCVVERG